MRLGVAQSHCWTLKIGRAQLMRLDPSNDIAIALSTVRAASFESMRRDSQVIGRSDEFIVNAHDSTRFARLRIRLIARRAASATKFNGRQLPRAAAARKCLSEKRLEHRHGDRSS